MKIYMYLLCVLLLAGCPGTDAPGGKKEVPDTPEVTPKGSPGEEAKKAATDKLFTAVKAGDASKVTEALTAGADKDAKDSAGWTALMWGAWNGNRDMVQALIDDGANVKALSTAGSSALKLATVKDHGAIVTLLKANKATGTPTVPTKAEKKEATTKLLTGATANNVGQVNEALEAGADVNAKDVAGWTALMWGAWNGHEATVTALIGKGVDVNALSTAGSSALKLATVKGHGAIVTLLKANKATGTPTAPTTAERKAATIRLFKAAKAGNVGQVNEAIEAGGNIDVWTKTSGTPLMWAAYKKDTATAQALIDKGADVKVVDDNGHTALMYAAGEGLPDIVNALIAKGANINNRNNKGDTPLMWAAYYGHPKAVEVLIAKGAKINNRNKKGETALGYAKKFHRTAIVKLLEAAGATE